AFLGEGWRQCARCLTLLHEECWALVAACPTLGCSPGSRPRLRVSPRPARRWRRRVLAVLGAAAGFLAVAALPSFLFFVPILSDARGSRRSIDLPEPLVSRYVMEAATPPTEEGPVANDLGRRSDAITAVAFSPDGE